MWKDIANNRLETYTMFWSYILSIPPEDRYWAHVVGYRTWHDPDYYNDESCDDLGLFLQSWFPNSDISKYVYNEDGAILLRPPPTYMTSNSNWLPSQTLTAERAAKRKCEGLPARSGSDFSDKKGVRCTGRCEALLGTTDDSPSDREDKSDGTKKPKRKEDEIRDKAKMNKVGESSRIADDSTMDMEQCVKEVCKSLRHCRLID